MKIEFAVSVCLLLCATSTMALLGAEKRHLPRLKMVSKTLAAACFVAAGLLVGPSSSSPAPWVLGALALSMVGDVALLQKGAGRGFVIGLFAFFLAHLAYVGALWVSGVHLLWGGTAGVLALLSAGVVVRWLWPRVSQKLRGPVIAYIGVISFMLCSAVGAYAAAPQPATGFALAGAVAFYLSDLFVARDRFVSPGFVNKALGLPLYFGAQILWVLWLSALANP